MKLPVSDIDGQSIEGQIMRAVNRVTGEAHTATVTGGEVDFGQLEYQQAYEVYGITADGQRQTYVRLITETTQPAPDPEPPTAAPEGLTATAVSTFQVDLSWDAVSGATSYEYRIDSGSAISVGANTSAEVMGLSADTQYSFQVRARNEDGAGPWSGVVVVTTNEGVDGVGVSLLANDFELGEYDEDSLHPLLNNPAGEVGTNLPYQLWGAPEGTQHFQLGTSNLPVAITKDDYADVEVEGWSRRGRMFCRWSEEDGTAVGLEFNLEAGNISLRIFKNIGVPDSWMATSWADNYVTTFINERDLSDYIPEFDKSQTPEGHRFMLGVSGLTVYVKFSDDHGASWQELYRSSDTALAALPNPGKVVWAKNSTKAFGYRFMGFRTVGSDQDIYSDLANGILDARDFGVKTLEAIGNITAGSTELVLDHNPGFEVGDDIVIGVNTSRPEGQRGSREGVGGYWPGRSVATLDDLSEVESGNAYVESEDWVYSAGGSKQSRYDYAAPSPLALKTKVVSVDGNTLTIEHPAQGPGNDVPVHFNNDNTFFFNGVLNRASHVPVATEIRLPEGNIVITEKKYLNGHTDVVLSGAGKHHTTIYAPDGIPSPVIQIDSSGVTVRDIGLRGTGKDHGYGRPQSADQGRGLLFNIADTGYVQNVHGVDLPTNIATSRYTHLDVRNTTDRMTDGILRYFQWKFQLADGSAGGLVQDCSFAGYKRIQGAFEPFRAHNVVFKRISAHNGVAAINSAQGVTFDDVHFYIAEGSDIDFGTPGQEYDEWWDYATGNMGINANDNIGSLPSAGGQPTINNFVIAFGGFINESKFLWGFQANPTNWKEVKINGGLYWVPRDRLTITAGSSSPAVILNGTVDSNHFVDGFRSYGKHPTQHPGGDIVLRNDATGTIQNCVADNINLGNNGVGINNQSLEDWRASVDRTQLPVADFRIVDIKGEGAYDLYAYDVSEENETINLSYSPWGYIIRYSWRILDDQNNVVATDETRYGTVRLPEPGTYTVELTVWDEDEQTATTTKTITWS